MSSDLPGLDIGIAAIWLLISIWHWIGHQPDSSVEPPEERALGASVILGQLGAVITGASIILAGIGAFVALSNNLGDILAKNHIFYAALWAVVALGLAIFTIGVLPRTPRGRTSFASGALPFYARCRYFSVSQLPLAFSSRCGQHCFRDRKCRRVLHCPTGSRAPPLQLRHNEETRLSNLRSSSFGSPR